MIRGVVWVAAAAIVVAAIVFISYSAGRPKFAHRELTHHWFAAVPFGLVCGTLALVLVLVIHETMLQMVWFNWSIGG